MDISKHKKEIAKFDRMARDTNDYAIRNRTTQIMRNYEILHERGIGQKTLEREYNRPATEDERNSRWQRFLDLWFPISFTDERAGDVYVRQFIEIDYWRHSLNRFARRRDFHEIQEENQILYSQLRVAYRLRNYEEVGAIMSQITANDYEMKKLVEKEAAEMPRAQQRPRAAYALKGAVVDLSRWRKTA